MEPKLKEANYLRICLSVCSVQENVWFSTSDGLLGVLKLGESLSYLSYYKTVSDYECWSVVSHKNSPDIGYMSSDSGAIYCYDARTNKGERFTNAHDYGVCSLTFPINLDSGILCSSGFDNKMLFWDIRNTRAPCSSHPIPFTAWNVKWFGDDKVCACVSAMAEGSHVINVDKNLEKVSIVNSFFNVESLAYSTDYLKIDGDESSPYFCTTSFYDNKIHIWNNQPKSEDVTC